MSRYKQRAASALPPKYFLFKLKARPLHIHLSNLSVEVKYNEGRLHPRTNDNLGGETLRKDDGLPCCVALIALNGAIFSLVAFIETYVTTPLFFWSKKPGTALHNPIPDTPGHTHVAVNFSCQVIVKSQSRSENPQTEINWNLVTLRHETSSQLPQFTRYKHQFKVLAPVYVTLSLFFFTLSARSLYFLFCGFKM